MRATSARDSFAGMTWILGIVGLLLVVTIYDLVQTKHAILRNFPIIGHFRYILEAVGPELRQYIVTSNNEELPFSRDQRGWVYASAKKQNNYTGFGTDNDYERSPNYLVIKHDTLGKPDRLVEIMCDMKPLHGAGRRLSPWPAPTL